jgi:mannose-6-phosphate isomerase-like protein (cupin superfamily)
MNDTTTTPARAHHSPEGSGESWWFFDALMTVRSDGGPVVIEATVAPGGGAPLHVHTDLDDSFFLRAGRLAMRCGDETFLVEPGAYVRVLGDDPAVMLQVHTDDSFLRFIRGVGRRAPYAGLPEPSDEMDMEAAFRVAAETGQPVVGPPMTDQEAAEVVGA